MPFERKCAWVLIGAIMIAFSAMSVGAESPSGGPAPPGRAGAFNPAPSGPTGKTLTGKERLAGKASDEQRIDNCKVPPQKRGPKPRPDSCERDRISRR